MSNNVRLRSGETIEAAVTDLMSRIPVEFKTKTMRRALIVLVADDLRSVTTTFAQNYDGQGICRIACELAFGAYGAAKLVEPVYMNDLEYAAWKGLRDYAKLMSFPNEYPPHFFEADGIMLVEV